MNKNQLRTPASGSFGKSFASKAEKTQGDDFPSSTLAEKMH